jgi:hypothetical protein
MTTPGLPGEFPVPGRRKATSSPVIGWVPCAAAPYPLVVAAHVAHLLAGVGRLVHAGGLERVVARVLQQHQFLPARDPVEEADAQLRRRPPIGGRMGETANDAY